jgi:alpha-beta hydrolase superfamily lysophospholipase
MPPPLQHRAVRTVTSVTTDAARDWTPDVLDGFEQTTIAMPPSWDGDVDIVVVRRVTALDTGSAVLYVHGFGDYFFQRHLADFYDEQGIRFYAVDLRRHGRAIRPHQHPDTTRHIDEYVADIDRAIELLRDEEDADWLLVNGHSTGGLAAAVHAARGAHRSAVDAIFLNSPFLDMNLPAWQESVLEPVLAAIGGVLPNIALPSLNSLYGDSIHESAKGSWAFDLAWKPLAGFPATTGWFRAIHDAQGEVADGLDITAPVLVLHAWTSLTPKVWSEDIRHADIVLDVDDIARLSLGLGPRVEVHAVPDGIHDLVLSEPGPRAAAFERVRDWLSRIH